MRETLRWYFFEMLPMMFLVVMALVMVTAPIVILVNYQENRRHKVSEQLQLDTLYEAMVGDSNSVRSGLRDVTDQLTELCLVIALAKEVDESYCTEQPE